MNLSDLLANPVEFLGDFVRLENLTVQDVVFPMVNLTDSTGGLTVRLENFTSPPEIVRPGDKVNVQGPWSGVDRNGNGRADPGEFFLNVKNGTSDHFEKAG